MPAEEATPAIVLRTRDYMESDRIVTLLTEQMGKLFCELVCDWDLVDGGKPLPLTPDIVAGRLPGPVFNAVMQAIGEDGRAEQEEKKALSATSVATSLPRGKRAKSRNGTRTSEQQNTWA